MSQDAKITVIIPTYNRCRFIAYFLEHSVKSYKGTLFCFEIHDSSTNDETSLLINDFNKKNNIKIKYFSYDSKFHGDLKAFFACQKVQTDFFYLMGDGFSPDFNELEHIILNNLDQLDLIIFDFFHNLSIPQNVIIEISSMEEKRKLCCDSVGTVTLFGSYIFKTSLFQGISNSEKTQQLIDINTHFINFISLFNSFVNAPFLNFEVINSDGFLFINPHKIESGWLKDYILVLCYDYTKAIDCLDGIYSPCLKELKLRHEIDTRWSHEWKICLNSRMKNGINFKVMHKYKKEIKESVPHYFHLYFYCLIPRFILKICYKVYRSKDKK